MSNISLPSPRSKTMPHVIVKLWPGKSDDQKRHLSDAIVRDVINVLNYGDESVSVAFEEVSASDWTEKVVQPEIIGKWDKLTKEPGYVPKPRLRHQSKL